MTLYLTTLMLRQQGAPLLSSMIWYDLVWYGVEWCGVVWCGVVWCGVVWCDVVPVNMTMLCMSCSEVSMPEELNEVEDAVSQ